MTRPVLLATEMDNRLFYFSLAASVVVHIAVLAAASVAAKNIRIFEKPVKTIELTYQTIKEEPKQEIRNGFKEVQLVPSRALPPDPPVEVKDLSRKYDIFSSLASPSNHLPEPARSGRHLESSEKQMPSIKSLGAERKITVPLLQSEKITNSKYLSYTQNIRQRIRQRAYYYAQNPDFASGDVYLTFVLASTGALEAVKIIPGKTHANAYLQDIGLRSIQESAPFPPFPADLSFPELTFNVIISFELTEE